MTHEGMPAGTWTPEALDPAVVVQHIEALTPPEDIRAGRQFGVHIIDGDDPSAVIARFVEAVVLYEFFGNDLEVMQKEYAKYDRVSIFLAVLDYEAQQPVGVIRIIRPSELGLKSMDDIVDPASPWYRPGDTLAGRYKEIGDDPEHTVDISTMAVMPEYRSSHARDGASAALYSTCVRWSFANGYNHWVTIVDTKIYTMMQSWGEPFTPFEDAVMAPYLDSAESIPAHTELYSGIEKIRHFDEEMTKQLGQSFDVLGLYLRGAGLEQTFVLPDFPDAVQ